MRTLRIGLTDKQREGSIRELNVALSTEMLLQIKIKKIHWDIVGPQFLTLHKLLDEQYQKVADTVDEMAERVRQLGGYPVGTASGFLELAKIKEHPGSVVQATQSLLFLLDDNETLTRGLREAIERCDTEYKDRGTSDFFTKVLQDHEEMAWMLRSFVEGEGVHPDGEVKLTATPSKA